MFKKVSLLISLFAFFGFGLSQLMAFSIYPILSDQQLCCPDTYNGGNFVVAIDYGTYVNCLYTIEPGIEFQDYYCQ